MGLQTRNTTRDPGFSARQTIVLKPCRIILSYWADITMETGSADYFHLIRQLLDTVCHATHHPENKATFETVDVYITPRNMV